MKGEPVDDAALAREIAPCFVTADGARTDCIVLACTHYPLLLDRFASLAPWRVAWIDPAPAIARRVDHVLAEGGFALSRDDAQFHSKHRAVFTSDSVPTTALMKALRDRSLVELVSAPIPVFA
jgi:glutamate racemase